MGANQWVYFFGAGQVEGDPKDRALLGGKGAGLAEMTKLGLPVPPGFTITTEVCRLFNEGAEGSAGPEKGASRALPKGLEPLMREAMAKVERALGDGGQLFGDPKRPLLVSVRSGA